MTSVRPLFDELLQTFEELLALERLEQSLEFFKEKEDVESAKEKESFLAQLIIVSNGINSKNL